MVKTTVSNVPYSQDGEPRTLRVQTLPYGGTYFSALGGEIVGYVCLSGAYDKAWVQLSVGAVGVCPIQMLFEYDPRVHKSHEKWGKYVSEVISDILFKNYGIASHSTIILHKLMIMK